MLLSNNDRENSLITYIRVVDGHTLISSSCSIIRNGKLFNVKLKGTSQCYYLMYDVEMLFKVQPYFLFAQFSELKKLFNKSFHRF